MSFVDASERSIFQWSGPIMRANGPPRDTAGHVGNVFIDMTGGHLYLKSNRRGIESWGSPILSPPGTVSPSVMVNIKWYSNAGPTPALGADGDYALVWNPGNFGITPELWGPKTDCAWPQAGDGPDSTINFCALIAIGLKSENGNLGVLNFDPFIWVGIGSEVLGFNEDWTTIDTTIQEIGLATGGVLLDSWHPTAQTGNADAGD